MPKINVIVTYLMTYGPMLIVAADAAAAALPGKGDSKFWNATRQVLDVLAANFGNSKNAPK